MATYPVPDRRRRNDGRFRVSRDPRSRPERDDRDVRRGDARAVCTSSALERPVERQGRELDLPRHAPTSVSSSMRDGGSSRSTWTHRRRRTTRARLIRTRRCSSQPGARRGSFPVEAPTSSTSGRSTTTGACATWLQTAYASRSSAVASSVPRSLRRSRRAAATSRSCSPRPASGRVSSRPSSQRS